MAASKKAKPYELEAAQTTQRLPYSPPAIDEEIPIENVALACTGASPSPPPFGCGSAGYQTSG